MARRVLYRTGQFPYHLTARANNREPFPGKLKFIWKAFCGELFVQQALHEFQVHAFILMPNHFHLLATSPFRAIDEVMRDFIGSSTRIINHRNRRSGRIFGGPYHWSLVTNPLYFAHVYKYALRNPAKASMVDFVGEYEFSTYAGEVGKVPLPLRITGPQGNLAQLVPAEPQARDEWLNRPHANELNEGIRKGLRKKEFQLKPDSKTRRMISAAL